VEQMTNADELSRLFEAERAVHPPDEGMERGLSRLLADVAQGAAPLPVATGALKLGLSLVSKWLIVGFALGLGGAGLASQIWGGSAVAAPSATVRGVTVSSSVASHVAAPEASLTLRPTVKAVEESERSAGRPAPGASSMSAAVDVTTFDEELRLISAAKREQQRGRARAAEAWLLEHARRFPNGVFALDREALHVLVACSTQKQPALARAFAASHATSPMVPRLLRACGAPEAATRSRGDFSEIEK
jgi:hypothetical protein